MTTIVSCERKEEMSGKIEFPVESSKPHVVPRCDIVDELVSSIRELKIRAIVTFLSSGGDEDDNLRVRVAKSSIEERSRTESRGGTFGRVTVCEGIVSLSSNGQRTESSKKLTRCSTRRQR